jgi:hypothetical protein
MNIFYKNWFFNKNYLTQSTKKKILYCFYLIIFIISKIDASSSITDSNGLPVIEPFFGTPHMCHIISIQPPVLSQEVVVQGGKTTVAGVKEGVTLRVYYTANKNKENIKKNLYNNHMKAYKTNNKTEAIPDISGIEIVGDVITIGAKALAGSYTIELVDQFGNVSPGMTFIVDNAPVARTSQMTVREDTDHTFKESDFYKSGLDSSSLVKIRILTLPDPMIGNLMLDELKLRFTDQEILNSDISKLVFRPFINFMNATTSFTFKVCDSSGWSLDPGVINLKIIPLACAPTVDPILGTDSIPSDAIKNIIITGRGIAGASIVISISDGVNQVINRSIVSKNNIWKIDNVDISSLLDGTLNLLCIEQNDTQIFPKLTRSIFKGVNLPHEKRFSKLERITGLA